MEFESTAELAVQLDRLSRKLDYLFRHIGIEYSEESVPLYVLKAQEFIRQERDADAIKIVREQTAVGMIEARAIVEDLARRMGRNTLNIESVVPPHGVAGSISKVNSNPYDDHAAVEEAWRQAVRSNQAR